MALTVNNLYKELGKLIDKGHGRKPVKIHKSTFYHVLESDGCVILPVEKVRIEWIPTIDDNGGTKENKDGSESGIITCVLIGNNEDT
jgi:hypothetical protein